MHAPTVPPPRCPGCNIPSRGVYVYGTAGKYSAFPCGCTVSGDQADFLRRAIKRAQAWGPS